MQSDIKICFSKSAQSYDAYAEFQLFAAQKLVDTIIAPPTHILDIGCGTGILTVLLKQKFSNIHATLLDISPEMLAVARQKLGDNNISYACGSADNIELIQNIVQTDKIDMIISNLCFQWLNNPVDIIKTYQSYVPICISVLLKNSFYQWYESVMTQAPNFKPPITLLPKNIAGNFFEYHIRYKDGLDFLRSQKKLGTLITKTKPLSVKQIKQACTVFENNYDTTISYSLGIIVDF